MTLTALDRRTIAAADDVLHRLMATPEGHADPYPLYRRLREIAPLYRSDLDGNWYASSFAGCRQLLGDDRIGKNDQFIVARHGVDEERVRLARRRSRPSMITSNPPEHARLRGVAKGAFIPPRIEDLRPRVAAIVAERIEHLASLGDADIIAELAYPLPVTVIGELVGVPPEDREWFRPLMNILISSDNPNRSPEHRQKVEQAGNELETYFLDLIGQRRRRPAGDLLSGFVAEQEQGRMAEDEVFATVTLLFLAGFLTTTNLVGNGMLALLRHPGEMARLWSEPALVAPAVEEMLRYDSPVQFVHRTVLGDLDLEGHRLEAGDVVFTLLAAANRDPARFTDPDRFDVARRDNLHLAFAWGLHFCLGARLARLEGQLVFAGLRERFATIELLDEPPRHPGLALRFLDELRLHFTPR